MIGRGIVQGGWIGMEGNPQENSTECFFIATALKKGGGDRGARKDR